MPTRRQFLGHALGTSAALALAPSLGAIDPIRRVGPPRLQLGLAAYSFRDRLNLTAKPRPRWTLDDFIDFAAKLELPSVELTAYYFRETTPAYLDALKARCQRHKMVVSGTAVGNDFCLSDPVKLQAQVDMVRAWIEHTARLGGRTVRIFAGRVPKGDNEAAARRRCIEKIEQVCEHAGRHRVTLALENHGGITATADQMLEIVRAVRSEWFAVNFDSGNFRTADPYADLARIAPYSVVAQLKTEIHPGGRTEDADLRRLTDILRKVGFQGFVVLEYEAREDALIAVPRHIATLKPLMG